MASLTLTVAASAVIAAAAVLLIGRSPAGHVPMPRPRPAIAGVPATEVHQWPVLQPTVVRTVPIVKPPPEPPQPVVEPPRTHPDLMPERPVHPRPKYQRMAREAPADRADICQRHRLRKVYTDSGRSWRCRR